MLRLEGFMEIQKLHHDGVSVSEIARQLNLDRKTVRKYLRQAPREYKRKPKKWKVDPFRAYLRERWESGVMNASRLFVDIQKRGYSGGVTQVRAVLAPWRSEGQERAFVRFETAPGEQAQMAWGHFGNWTGPRLYGFALTLCWSRMRYVEFTQRQDAETLLNCMMHAFEFFGGVTRTVLTDNMKTVVVDRVDGQPRFHPKMLDFAAYYGFVPRVCRPYRPETKGKIESTIGFVKKNFWPGIHFESLGDLNHQAHAWMEKVNHQVHATTREVPYDRLGKERLLGIDEQPAYDTSYMEDRRVAKDCTLSYRGNRYSVPYRYAGKAVVVREPVAASRIEIYRDLEVIAEPRLVRGRSVMVMDPAHYAGIRDQCRRRGPASGTPGASPPPELTPGPGVGRGFVAPEVEQRSLTVYEEVADV